MIASGMRSGPGEKKTDVAETDGFLTALGKVESGPTFSLRGKLGG